MLEDAEEVEDNMYEGLQISHSRVFREDFEPDTAKVLVARSDQTFFDIPRTTNFDATRRVEHVEILVNDNISNPALPQNVLDFAAMAAFVAD